MKAIDRPYDRQIDSIRKEIGVRAKEGLLEGEDRNETGEVETNKQQQAKHNYYSN